MNPEPSGGLSLQMAQRHHAIGAVAISLLCILVTGAALPYSGHRIAAVAWFLPGTVSLACFAQVLTTVLLLLQFRRTGRYPLLAGSFAYFFTAAGMLAQMLVYPGVFSATGLFGATVPSAPWVWLVWHLGFSASILIAALMVFVTPMRETRRKMAMVLTPVLAIAMIAVVTVVAVRWVDRLPGFMTGNDSQLPVHGPAGIAIWATGWAALLAVAVNTRFRTRLQLWTGVALVTYLCETLLMLTSVERFTIGWYTSRSIIVVSATLLLSALMFEVDELYSAAYEANRVLHERSIRDSLTGAFLRRYLTEQLSTELGRARRDNTPLSVLLMDLDWFKRYNDQFGHRAGDDCLIAVCEAARKHLRRYGDFIARYGGEEFAIVLPSTPMAAAAMIADKIRAEIAALELFVSTSQAPIGVTVSIGVATGGSGEEMDERMLVEAADLALYEAKHSGRNRVVLNDETLGTVERRVFERS